jgi:hypothetical protein
MPLFQCEKCGRDFFRDYEEDEPSFVIRSGRRPSEPVTISALPTCPYCGAVQKSGTFSTPL